MNRWINPWALGGISVLLASFSQAQTQTPATPAPAPAPAPTPEAPVMQSPSPAPSTPAASTGTATPAASPTNNAPNTAPSSAQSGVQSNAPSTGAWRSTLGLGANYSTGNTRASTFSANADAVRSTAQDKWTLYGNAQYGKTDGVTSANLMRLGTRYDRDIGASFFGFGTLDLEKDEIALLKLRTAYGTGLGLHWIKTETTTFDVFGGLGYTMDRYDEPRIVDGELRSRYNYANLLLGEESTHKLTDNTSFKQRLVVYPNLEDRGEYRAQWDAGLSVAMTQTISLNVGLAMRHNSDPGPGVKRTDTLLTTGVSVKFD
jgi:putative salt-induced outer membrane protein